MTYAIDQIFKALGDPIRIQIVDTLAHGSVCACKLLEQFQITQPTLSFHMKILVSTGLVDSTKQGKWVFYELNHDVLKTIRHFAFQLESTKQNHITNCSCK